MGMDHSRVFEGGDLAVDSTEPFTTKQPVSAQFAPFYGPIRQTFTNNPPTTSPCTEPPKSPHGTASGLHGWLWVQDSLKRHDEAVVKDFTDDIDTLLVFAGLFSAVVTAFIIESYKWLQQDNSQAAVDILSRISTQLGGLTINQVFVNSTEPPLASLPPFIPSPVMVAINVLWFLSLVLNLSAALLGMLAKQWLREYLKWDSVLSPPQENVRLRQLRFQAWNDWGITTKISAIPALLEIALVLFFAGIITFLWTLHQTLAIIVSLAISIFLLIAFIVTIFPAFSHSCPYKSPSGWAVTVLYDRVLRGVKFAVYIIRTLKVHDRLSWPDYKLNWSNYYGKLESWRKRDLHLSLDKPLDFQTISTLSLLETRENAGTIIGDIIRLPLLVEALAWASRDLQDTWMLESIAECTPTLYRSQVPSARLFVGLHTAYSAIFPDKRLCGEFKENIHQANGTGPLNGVIGLYNVDRTLGKIEGALEMDGIPDGPLLLIMTTLLSDNLTYFCENAFSAHSTMNFRPRPFEMRIMVEALFLDAGLISMMTGVYRLRYAAAMVELYRQFSRKVINDALYPGLRTVFLQLLAQFGEISYNPEADSDEYSVLIADEQAKSRFMASEDYAQLAISICDRTLKIDRPAAEDRHLFVVMANMALSPNRQDYPGSEALKRGMLYDLLQNMTKISRIALDRGWTNCGSYVDLPWIDTLLNGIRNPDHLLPPFIPLIPPAFIDNTEEAIRRGLITGVGIRERFDELVQLWRQDQSAPAADITGSAVAGPSQNPEMQLSSTTGSTRACTTQDIATHVRD